MTPLWAAHRCTFLSSIATSTDDSTSTPHKTKKTAMEQQPNAQHEAAAIHPFKNVNTTQFPHLIKFLTFKPLPPISAIMMSTCFTPGGSAIKVYSALIPSRKSRPSYRNTRYPTFCSLANAIFCSRSWRLFHFPCLPHSYRSVRPSHCLIQLYRQTDSGNDTSTAEHHIIETVAVIFYRSAQRHLHRLSLCISRQPR